MNFGNFSLGGNASSSGTGGGMTSGSSFGGASSSNTNAATSGGFTFNANAGKTTNTGFGTGGGSTAPAGGLTFGGGATNTSNTSLSLGGTAFGAASSAPATGTTGAAPAFGATNTAATGSTTSSFSFGTNTTNAANTTGTTTPSFSFGGNANANNAAKPNTGFGFGSASTTMGTTGTTGTSTTTGNSAFSFGGIGKQNGAGFGGSLNGGNASAQPQNPLQNLSSNKQLLEQMNKKVETLDASLQNEISEINKLLEQQQGVIDSMGVPDEPSSQEVLERLQGLQFECERMKALQDGYYVHLQTLKSRQGQFEASLKQAQALMKREDSEGEIVSSFRAQRSVPSTFFEEVLKQVEDTVNRLGEKIENMEVVLSMHAASGEAVEKEMTKAERLINIMEREYNAFIEQSAAVASVVARMEEVKKKFLQLRTKEIETRRKNLTLMSGMQDVLANVLEDPFRAESVKSCVC